jgi:hypothetical protein
LALRYQVFLFIPTSLTRNAGPFSPLLHFRVLFFLSSIKLHLKLPMRLSTFSFLMQFFRLLWNRNKSNKVSVSFNVCGRLNYLHHSRNHRINYNRQENTVILSVVYHYRLPGTSKINRVTQVFVSPILNPLLLKPFCKA